MKKNRKKHPVLRAVLLSLLGLMIIAAAVFMYFGGFGTGECADVEEFAAAAKPVEGITIPDGARVIALGEATHGNAQFQQLKTDVFKVLVENYGVRAFALEGDYGGCEQANCYVHGGEGTAAQAAAAIGFAIYRTDEIAGLLDYMREYNLSAQPGDDLCFYGFDMQRYAYSLKFLLEDCGRLKVDASELEAVTDGGDWLSGHDNAERAKAVESVKTRLEGRSDAVRAVHLAEQLLQNISLGGTDTNYADLRNTYMAQNIQWIAQREAEKGHERIFVSAHNGHVAKWGSSMDMGTLLKDALGESYYVIGTDFYKTRCNMPRLPGQNRTKQVFYSYDPLAKAAKKAGFDVCWLDFAALPQNSELAEQAGDYCYMGSLGEGYYWYMHLLPPSYRILQPPAEMYDSMIFVANALPTEILGE